MSYPSQIDPDRIGVAGLELVEQKGWGAFSLRGVANALGVAPNALYRYVGDRKGLNIEVGAVAVEALFAVLMKATEGKGGRDHLLAAVHGYVDFAISRPDAYQAFLAGKPDYDDPRLFSWIRPWKVIMNAAKPLVPQAGLATGHALLAMIHGRVDLVQGALRAAEAADGLDDAVDALIAGYGTLGRVEAPQPRRPEDRETVRKLWE